MSELKKPAWMARIARHWPAYVALLEGKVCAFCGAQAETFSRLPKQEPVWYCRELCKNANSGPQVEAVDKDA